MKSYLNQINSSEDVKKLNISQMEVLAKEIREFLVSNVSKCGGHLSSNLGAVELTLALHKVFDFNKDKIVWDVGHQSYSHKLLTGRRDGFDLLRREGGISGFPKTEESGTDAFNTGHSSTSVSAALGYAKAFELQGKDAFAVAVIGDGALTGGMAYEALNHAGSGDTPLIVILNDNGMSIAQNVGGLSRYLERLRGEAGYLNLKVRVHSFLKGLPVVGEFFRRVAHRGKRFLKKILIQKKLFENMGLEYMGPVDGHDLKDLITAFEYAKRFKRPVIVHTKTQKGKGYVHSEKDPSYFHGVSSFDPKTGTMATSNKKSYSEVFGEELVKIAEEDKSVVAITAAMPQGTGLEQFAKRFPDRFFDVGIAEQHAVTFAAGLSKTGIVPVFAVYSTFLQRGYDQLLHDVSLQNLHTVFAIDRAGAVGDDGETHQGIYDFSYLSHMPNMTVMAPACGEELKMMLRFAVKDCKGPVAIRYPKSCSEGEFPLSDKVELGKGTVLKQGSDVLLVALGSTVEDALCAADILEESGISVAVMNARFLKPFDEDLFYSLAKEKRLVATIEDNVCIGGLSAAVRSIYDGKVVSFAHQDKPLKQATIARQKEISGIDGASVAEKIKKILGDLVG